MQARAAEKIDGTVFRETLGHYPTGVAIITGIGGDEQPVGMVVGSFTSMSMDPPLVAFSAKISSKSFPALRESKTFCVNVLAADQEAICRSFAVSGADKYAGIGWTPGPSGAPVLDDVVCWIECSWYDVVPAGDHYLVLGEVLDLKVSRTTLPLMFFQGGYGRFSLPSLTAADPDLIEAARHAERIRTVVESCAERLGVECSVLARLGDEIVTVASAGVPFHGGVSTVGQRAPHLAPLGSVFLQNADGEQEQRWMQHWAGDEEAVARIRKNLDAVRQRGYSLTLFSEIADQRKTLTERYSSPESLPADARRLRETIAASVDLYEPELRDDDTYDVYSIAMPVGANRTQGPQLALRLLSLPAGQKGSVVREWIDDLASTAETAERRFTDGD